jgi:hypothetical protein
MAGVALVWRGKVYGGTAMVGGGARVLATISKICAPETPIFRGFQSRI